MREWAIIWDASERGEYLKLIRQVCVKIKKGYTLERIAEELEEEPSMIKRIMEIANRFQPDYDPQLIYQALQLESVGN